ncbi:hypothetical protein [Segetibacter sp.]|jgi:hypothetical protein|nr:hypothetical protein [Segetibacter sp.]
MTNSVFDSLVKLQKKGISKIDTHDIFTILLILLAIVVAILL